MMADAHGLSRGGGGGFAFRLDDELREGTSQPTRSFGNPVLANAAEFTVWSLEVWSLL